MKEKQQDGLLLVRYERMKGIEVESFYGERTKKKKWKHEVETAKLCFVIYFHNDLDSQQRLECICKQLRAEEWDKGVKFLLILQVQYPFPVLSPSRGLLLFL